MEQAQTTNYMQNLKVEVFKTNVQHQNEACELIEVLLRHAPEAKINFDLQDCDHILRVEDRKCLLTSTDILKIIRQAGYQCEVLEG